MASLFDQYKQKLDQAVNGFLSSDFAKGVVNTGNRVGAVVPEAGVFAGQQIANIGKGVISPLANTLSKAGQSFQNIAYSNYNPGIAATKLVAPQTRSIPVNSPTFRDVGNVVQGGLAGVGAATNPAFGVTGALFGSAINSVGNLFSGKPITQGMAESAGQGLNMGLQSAPVVGATNPYLEKFVSPLGGKLTTPIASGLANVTQGLTLNATQGSSPTPLGVLADFGLGVAGGKNQFSSAGLNTKAPLKFEPKASMNPGDIAEFDKLIQIKNEKGGFRMSDINFIDNLLLQLTNATKKQLAELSTSQKANEVAKLANLSEFNINKIGFPNYLNEPQGKMRGFPETVVNSDNVPQQVKQAVTSDPNSYYQILKNKDVVERVGKLVVSDEAQALNIARNGSDTDANAAAILLIKKYLDSGKYDQAQQLISDVSPRFTKQGQQIQILSLFDRLTATGAVKYAQKIADKAKVQLKTEQIKNITEKAEAIKGATGVDRTAKVAQLVQAIKDVVPPTLGRKISTIQAMAQLINPTTAIRNIVGNTIFSGVENVSDVVGAGLDRAISVVTGQRSKVLPSLDAQLQGAKQGLKQGIDDALKGIDTSRGVATQFDLPSTMTFQKGIMNKIEKVMNIELRAPDRAAYEAAFQGSINNQMRAAGVSQASEDMMKVAHADALYRTFQDNSFLSRFFSGAKRLLNANKDFGLGDLVLKYPKTPANILSRGLDYSPAGFIKGIYEAVRPLLTGEQFNQKSFVESLSRGMVGSGIITAGYILSKAGIITGRPEKDKDIAGTQRAIGSGGFKINVDALKRFFMTGFAPQKDQQSDLVLSYDWAQPTALPLTMGANYALGGKSQDQITNFLESTDAAAEAITQQPLFKSVSNLANDVSTRGISTAVSNAVMGAPASFVPTVVSKVAQTVDPMARETYDPNVFNQAKNQVVNKTPILRQTLPEKVDVFGRPVQYGSDNIILRTIQNFLSPAIVTRIQSNPSANEVLRLFDTTGEVSQAPNVVARNLKINGENVRLNGQQMANYQKYIGSRAEATIQKLINDPKYQQLAETDKAQLISNYLSDINTAAKIQLFGNKPNSVSANVQDIIDGKNTISFKVTKRAGGKVSITRLTKVKKVKVPKIKKLKLKKPKKIAVRSIKVKKIKLPKV